MVLDQLVGAPDGVGDRFAVPRQRDLRRQLDRPLQRLDVVPERIGAALRPEADRRRDPPEQVVGRDEHPVLEEAELAVGMPGRRHELPAVEPVAVAHELRVGLIADERAVDVLRSRSAPP